MFEGTERMVTFVATETPRRKPIGLPADVGLPKGATLRGVQVVPLKPKRDKRGLDVLVEFLNPPGLKRARKAPDGSWAAITLPFKVRTGDTISLWYTTPPTIPGGMTQDGLSVHRFARFAENAAINDTVYELEP